MVDALANAIGFFLSGGQAHDLVGADHLLPTIKAEILLADKAYDANERVIAVLHSAEKTAVIPAKANRKVAREYDRSTYKARHLIENFFADLKQYRAIANRCDKTARKFLAAVHLAAAAMWLKCRQALVNFTSLLPGNFKAASTPGSGSAASAMCSTVAATPLSAFLQINDFCRITNMKSSLTAPRRRPPRAMLT